MARLTLAGCHLADIGEPASGATKRSLSAKSTSTSGRRLRSSASRRGQQPGPKRHGRCDAEKTARGRMQLRRLGLRCLDVGEDLAAALVIGPALLGQALAPGGAVSSRAPIRCSRNRTWLPIMVDVRPVPSAAGAKLPLSKTRASRHLAQDGQGNRGREEFGRIIEALRSGKTPAFGPKDWPLLGSSLPSRFA